MGNTDHWDDAGWKKRIDDERRTFRRERKLDLRWAVLLYAIALIEGFLFVALESYGFGIAAICFAISAAIRLNASFENGEI